MIEQELERIQTAKDGIRAAIEAKGVVVPPGDGIDTYAGKIDLIKTGIISVKDEGISFGGSTFTNIPDYYSFDGVTDISRMFSNCVNLVSIPDMDISPVGDMYEFAYRCKNLERLPVFTDTSKITNISYMADGCSKVTSVPDYDLSAVQYMVASFRETAVTHYESHGENPETREGLFYNCLHLESVGPLECSNCRYNGLDTILGGNTNNDRLTYLGGFRQFRGRLNLERLSSLTQESVLNVVTELGDVNGVTEYVPYLKFNRKVFEAIPPEVKAIAIGKGYSVTSN